MVRRAVIGPPRSALPLLPRRPAASGRPVPVGSYTRTARLSGRSRSAATADLLGGDFQNPVHGGAARAAGRRTARRTGTVRRRGRRRWRAGPATPARSGPAPAPSPRRGALRGEPGQLLVDGGLDVHDDRVAGGLDVEPAERGRAGQAQQPEAGRDGEAVAAHQAVVEAGGLPAAEDGECQVGGVGLAGAVVRQPVGGHQGAGGHLLVDDLAQLPPMTSGSVPSRGGLAVVGGDGAEVLLDPARGSAPGRCRRRPTGPRCWARSTCGRTRGRPPGWPRPDRPSSRWGCGGRGGPSG